MKKNCIEEHVIDYILECDSEQLGEITLDMLARLFNVSRRSLHGKLKDRVGTSPGQYITRVKMMRAANMIESDHYLKVRELSDLMGFCNCDYFIRVFKLHFGVSPNKYRNLRKKESNCVKMIAS